jgi:Rps23 Pro-64 3,4-dihydroxylase Tpa1-like proline 4-hydroxylase
LAEVERLTGRKFKISRVYANGQTHGLPGDAHRDVSASTLGPERFWTFLYYVNPEWDARWAGQTMIMSADGELSSVMPTRNAAVLFRSDLVHWSAEPSRHCRELRVTVALKLEERP